MRGKLFRRIMTEVYKGIRDPAHSFRMSDVKGDSARTTVYDYLKELEGAGVLTRAGKRWAVSQEFREEVGSNPRGICL